MVVRAQLAAAGGTEGDAREGGADDYFSDARSVGSGHAGPGSWTAAAGARAPGSVSAARPACPSPRAGPSAISAISSGTGRSLLALARSYRPSSPGCTLWPPTSTRGGCRSLPVREASSCPSLARLAFSFAERGVPFGPVSFGTTAALVRAAVDRAGQDLAAVAVLVAVRGEAVERLLQLGVRVAVVQVVVLRAVGQRAGVRGGRQQQQRESAQQEELSYDSNHSAKIPPRGGGEGGRGGWELDRHLPRRAAQASNHYGAARRVACQPEVLPGKRSSLNASDPAFGAKLRCVGALRNRRSRPRAVPRTAVRTAGGAGPDRPAGDLPGGRPAGLGSAPGLVHGAGRLRERGAARLAAPPPRAHAADGRARPRGRRWTGPTRRSW